MQNLFIRIPGTTANLGPGFDVFGIALNLYNYLYFELNDTSNFEIYTLENELLPFSNKKQNLIYQSYKNVLSKYGYTHETLPKWKVYIHMDVSVGKGFGSSATAIVAGVQIAKKVLERDHIEINLEKEIEYFLELENHPDNVVPARLGGWVFCYDTQNIIRKELPEDLGLCCIIPDFSISTDDSRSKLKEFYPKEDIISNMKGCLLWLEYIYSKNPKYLIKALISDKIHEPYRYPQIPYIKEIKEFVYKINCYGMSLSGSGPGIIIYYDKNREEFYKAQLNELIIKLNTKKDMFSIQYCSPDYTGLVIYPENTDWKKFIFQNSKSLLI